MADQDGIVQTPSEQIKTQASQQVKQHIVYDGEGRPKYVFTAPIGAVDGNPCTCTEYVYKAANTQQVIDRQERDYRWKDTWGTQGDGGGFQFSASSDIDPDGDGDL